METEKMARVLKEFEVGTIEQEEALEELQDAEAFDFYAATVELYLEDPELEKGDSPKISNLFKDLYSDDFSQLISELEKSHPIKKLMVDHTQVERLLNRLEKINQEIKDNSSSKKLGKIKLILDGVEHIKNHIRKEEELIFPLWYEKKGTSETLLLEEEHNDILKSHNQLSNKLDEDEQRWKVADWRRFSKDIDEFISEIRFHVFHEGDIFYPIIVDEFSEEELKDINDKIDKIDEEDDKSSLVEYINNLDLQILQKKD